MKTQKQLNSKKKNSNFLLLLLISGILLIGLLTSCSKPLIIPGASFGYYIWKDSSNNIRLVWSADRRDNSFSGTVKTDGSFDSVEKLGIENDDKINISKKEIDFNAKLSAQDYADEIVISDSNYSYIEFDLKVNGQYDASRINVGKYLNNPEGQVFKIDVNYFENLREVPWYNNHPYAEFFHKLFANKYLTFVYIYIIGIIIIELLRITKFASKKKKGLLIGISYLIVFLIDSGFFIMLWYANGH
ncbi:hypothetical protein LLG07_08545 [bacterium]|nr:hypothetical protein [bacterium]